MLSKRGLLLTALTVPVGIKFGGEAWGILWIHLQRMWQRHLGQLDQWSTGWWDQPHDMHWCCGGNTQTHSQGPSLLTTLNVKGKQPTSGPFSAISTAVESSVIYISCLFLEQEANLILKSYMISLPILDFWSLLNQVVSTLFRCRQGFQ